MSITAAQLRELPDFDGNVVAPDGDKIGAIGQVYLDDQTGDPSWVTAKTGLFGTGESFVTLDGATLQGRDIQVAFDKDKVKGAPRVDDDGALSPQEEDELYSYYGHGTQGTSVRNDASDVVVDRDATATTGTVGTGTTTRGTEQVGHDTSGPSTDDSMTRSEERLRVGTQTREAGRARLRKYVVTENVTQTVPVSHEEVRIEREPITDANIGDATSGPAISEEEHEVVLHEETPVVAKETVPVERVRLDKETVTEQATVSEDVRKEQIDTDIDPDVRGSRNS
ncbi:MAG: YsnF/AvaK domain-containing protein [Janthinobacterium lividum]